MKKLCYLSEDISFVYRYFLYGAIILFIIAIAANPQALLNKSAADIIAELIAVIIMLGLVGTIIFLIVYLANRKTNKKLLEIKQKGKKLKGTIIGWNKDFDVVAERFLYTVYVLYNDLNRKRESV